MYIYRIRELWDGKTDEASQYYDRVYTRGYASRIAKDLFRKNNPGNHTPTDPTADESYLTRRRYLLLIIYNDQDITRERNGEVVEVWDSTYGRNGRKLSVKERKEAFPFTPTYW